MSHFCGGNMFYPDTYKKISNVFEDLKEELKPYKPKKMKLLVSNENNKREACRILIGISKPKTFRITAGCSVPCYRFSQEVHDYVERTNVEVKFCLEIFKRNRYGGYIKIRDKSTSRFVEPRELVNKIKDLWKLPPIEKTDPKPKDDRNLIFQNAFVRMVQEKCETLKIPFRVHRLAKSDIYNSMFYVHNNVTITMSQKFVNICHQSLGGDKCKRIPINIYSPKFNPNELMNKIINLSRELYQYETEMRCLLNKHFDDFDGGTDD